MVGHSAAKKVVLTVAWKDVSLAVLMVFEMVCSLAACSVGLRVDWMVAR